MSVEYIIIIIPIPNIIIIIVSGTQNSIWKMKNVRSYSHTSHASRIRFHFKAANKELTSMKLLLKYRRLAAEQFSLKESCSSIRNNIPFEAHSTTWLGIPDTEGVFWASCRNDLAVSVVRFYGHGQCRDRVIPHSFTTVQHVLPSPEYLLGASLPF